MKETTKPTTSPASAVVQLDRSSVEQHGAPLDRTNAPNHGIELDRSGVADRGVQLDKSTNSGR